MKIWHAITLAAAVGLGLGVIATRSLAAHPKRSVYVVMEADEITDGDTCCDGHPARPVYECVRHG